MPSDLLVLIDGHYYAYRFFHGAVAVTGADGRPNHVLRAFADLFTALRRDDAVTHWALVTDHPSPSFRHDVYPPYKAHRPPMPADLRRQLESLAVLAEAMAVPRLSVAGFEADDTIASLAQSAAAAGMQVRICTRDKDIDQILDERIQTWDPLRGELRGPAECLAERGVHPHQVVDYLCMLGDSADNVPGIRGIGAISARRLLAAHGSLDAILAGAGDHGPRRRDAIAAYRPLAERTRRLITLARVPDLPPPATLRKAPALADGAETVLGELGVASARHRVPPSAARPPSHRLTPAQIAAWHATRRADDQAVAIAIEGAELHLVVLADEEHFHLPLREARHLRAWLRDADCRKWLGAAVGERLGELELDLAGVEEHHDLLTWLGTGGAATAWSEPPSSKAYRHLTERVAAVGNAQIYRGRELPLAEHLRCLGRRGCVVDRERLAERREHLTAYLASLRRELGTGEHDLASPRTLQRVLGEAHRHADRVALEAAAQDDEDARLLLQARSLQRLLERDLARLEAQLAVSESSDAPLTIRYRWAAEHHGEIRAHAPDLEAVHRAGAHGEDLIASLAPSHLRRLVIAIPQPRLRALAAVAPDPALLTDLDAEDPEAQVAARVLARPPELLTSRDRWTLRCLVAALVDGHGEAHVARRLGCSRSEAASLRRDWNISYPEHAEALDAQAAATSVTTCFGRCRQLAPATPPALQRRIAQAHLLGGSLVDARKLAYLAAGEILVAQPAARALICGGHLHLWCPSDTVAALASELATALERSFADHPLWSPTISAPPPATAEAVA